MSYSWWFRNPPPLDPARGMDWYPIIRDNGGGPTVRWYQGYQIAPPAFAGNESLERLRYWDPYAREFWVVKKRQDAPPSEEISARYATEIANETARLERDRLERLRGIDFYRQQMEVENRRREEERVEAEIGRYREACRVCAEGRSRANILPHLSGGGTQRRLYQRHKRRAQTHRRMNNSRRR